MSHVTHPLSYADISNFSPEISKFCYIKKYVYRLHFDTEFLILLTFHESLKNSTREHFYERSYHNLNFTIIWPEKLLFWGVVLVQGQQFGIGTRYELEILHQKIKTKSQQVLAAIFHVCRSSRGKTGREPFCPPPHPEWN